MTSMGNAGGSAFDTARRLREQADELNRAAAMHEKGGSGEVRVAAALRQLDSRFSVLDDLDVPRSKANLDHVVIGPTGVWLIDAKAYSGTLKLGSGTLWNGRTPIRHECEKAQWEAERLSQYMEVPVHTVLCFVDTGLPAPVVPLNGVTVCSLEAVVDLVRSGPVVLQPEVVEVLTAQAAPLVRGVMAGPSAPQPKSTQQPASRPKKKAASKPAPAPGLMILRLAGVLAVFGLFIAMVPTISRVVGNWYAEKLEESLPVPPTSDSELTTTVVPETTVAPVLDAAPTVQFTCPAPGAGWDATFVATAFVADPDGYHVWYRVGGDAGNWTYVGIFRSGLKDVTGAGSISSLTSFELRYDRAWLDSDPTQTAGYAAFTTGADC